MSNVTQPSYIFLAATVQYLSIQLFWQQRFLTLGLLRSICTATAKYKDIDWYHRFHIVHLMNGTNAGSIAILIYPGKQA